MRTKSSKYHNVYHLIKTDILSGKYRSGEFLPPENEMMQTFSVSRTTVRQAIAILKEEQLVGVRQGKGTQVLHSGSIPTPFGINGPIESGRIRISNRFKQAKNTSIPNTQAAIIDLIQAEVDVADALRIEVGSPVYRLQRLKLIEDVIFAYVVSYIPKGIAPGLEKYSGGITHLYHFLRDEYGVALDSIENMFSAVSAGFFEAKVLNVEVGTPLLLSSRIAISNGTIFDYSQRFIRSDMYGLVINVEEAHLNPKPEPLPQELSPNEYKEYFQTNSLL